MQMWLVNHRSTVSSGLKHCEKHLQSISLQRLDFIPPEIFSSDQYLLIASIDMERIAILLIVGTQTGFQRSTLQKKIEQTDVQLSTS